MQDSIDLINNNIIRDVQEECGYTGYVHIAAIWMMRIMNDLQFIKLSLVDVMRLSL